MTSAILRKMRILGRHMLRGKSLSLMRCQFLSEIEKMKLKNHSMKIKIDLTLNLRPLLHGCPNRTKIEMVQVGSKWSKSRTNFIFNFNHHHRTGPDYISPKFWTKFWTNSEII